MNEILKNCNLLNNEFSFWFHNPNDTNWSIESYHEILHFTTVEEFWVLINNINNYLIENGMFFIMKEGIMPIWEDEKNLNGGCVSLRIPKIGCKDLWVKFLAYFISNNLDSKINGISISPKKNFNIIKLWYSCEVNQEDIILPDRLNENKEKLLYRSHKYNIEKDKQRIN